MAIYFYTITNHYLPPASACKPTNHRNTMKALPKLKLALILTTAALECAVPTGLAESSPPPTAAQSPAQAEKKLGSEQFVYRAVAEGMRETRLAQLASIKAVTPEVISYTSRLLGDYQQATDQLTAIGLGKGYKLPSTNDMEQVTDYNEIAGASPSGIAGSGNGREAVGEPAPASKDSSATTGRDTTHKGGDDHSILAEFRGLNGPEFERAYLKELVSAHHKAILLYLRAEREVDDEDVKIFATSNLPILRDHLRDAQRLTKQFVAQR